MNEMSRKQIIKNIPYLPAGRTIAYVPADNQFMQAAREMSEQFSLDPSHPTGAVVVWDDQIIARGANGSIWHEQHGCERKRRNTPTGTGYDLCAGCHPQNHAEQKAIANVFKALPNSEVIKLRLVENRELLPMNSDLYLWGHWWCCHSCWERMIAVGVRSVYLVEGAAELF